MTPNPNTSPHSRSEEGTGGADSPPKHPPVPTDTPRDQWIADHMTPTYYPETDQWTT